MRGRTPPTPIATLIAGMFLLGLALVNVRNDVHIHQVGHRVLARIAYVSHQRHGSTTGLTFTTPAGAAQECSIGGALGEVGRPLWIRYLPSQPSQCRPDALMPHLAGQFVFAALGIASLVGSWLLYRRAQRGESVRPT